VFFNIVAPGIVTDHISGGFTYSWAKNFDIDFAAAYVPRNTITGPNPNPASMGGTGDITLAMSQWEASLGVRYRY
jgi:long-chain fatty acid transport protein